MRWKRLRMRIHFQIFPFMPLEKSPTHPLFLLRKS